MTNEPAPAALPGGISPTAFSSLFQAVNGLRNQRALIAMIGCTVLGVLVAGLLFSMGGFLGGLLGFVVWVVAVGTGINAAGTLHMDSARGISPRSVVDALVFGLTCIPKLLVLGLALFAVAIAVFIVLAILLFICKIPFLGPLLFAVVFPLSVVVAGVTSFGLFLCMALSLPAIWQGATISRALAQTLAIARSRLVEAVLLLVFVGLLGFAVSLIVFAVLGFGAMPTLGMSAAIVGFGGVGEMGGMGMGGLMGMAQGMGGGHAIAGMIGGFVLWALAISLVSQVSLLGLSLVYLRVTEGLDLTGAEEAMRQSFDDARRRTAELGEKARNAAQRATEGAAESAGTGAAGVAAGASAAAMATPFPGDPLAGMAPPAASAVPPAYTPPSFAASPPEYPAAPPAYAAPPPAYPAPPPAYAAPPPEYAAPPPAYPASPPAFPAPAPTAFAAAPPVGFAASPPHAEPPFMPPPLGPETTAPFFAPTTYGGQTLDLPLDEGADITLPFDDVSTPPVHAAPTLPAAAAAPSAPAGPPTSYGVPPAYVPPPLPVAPPLPAAAATTCPQCLSPVTPEDVFCGVCGYRLK